MKIGTDGVLLGAWAQIRDAKRILDAGTGCGIIALMLAQRTAEIGSRIAAIDIDENAAVQAVENFAASPWPDRLPGQRQEVHHSVEQFSCSENADGGFDLVVCNPPFFSSPGSLPASSRNTARHATELDRTQLFQAAHRLLDANGRFCLVLPFEQADSTVESLAKLGLSLWSRTDVRPTPDSLPKRVLLEFGMIDTSHEIHNDLVVETARHQYSEDYADLTRDFHLRYAK